MVEAPAIGIEASLWFCKFSDLFRAASRTDWTELSLKQGPRKLGKPQVFFVRPRRKLKIQTPEAPQVAFS